MPKLVLLWLSMSFIAGIATAGAIPFRTPWFFIPLLVSALLSFILYLTKTKRRNLLFISLLLTSFLFGLSRYAYRAHKDMHLVENIPFTGSSVTIRARVVEPSRDAIEHAETTIQIIEFLDEDNEWQPFQSRAQMRLPTSFSFAYGTTLTLKGNLIPSLESNQKPHTAWLVRNRIAFRMYYPQVLQTAQPQGISLMGLLHGLKTRAHQVLQSIIPFPECELLAGILLGIEDRIPDFLAEAYRITGTAHIIAISGFNMSLLANIVSRSFNRIFPYRVGAVASILVIALYTLFIGPQPAVLRAALMAIITIPAYLIGRSMIGMHALCVTAALMMLFNPYLLWDVSFQLSFGATFGLMAYTTYFSTMAEKYIQCWKPPSPQMLLSFISDFFLTTLAAQIATFPVLLHHFAEFSIFSPLVNLIILPLQPAIMILGGIAMITGLVSLPLGRVLGIMAWLVAAFNDQIILLFALIPQTLSINSEIMVFASILLNLLILLAAMRSQKKRSSQYALF